MPPASVQILDVVASCCRAHAAEMRRAGTVLVQFVQRNVDAGLVGDGQQVQHRVGRTAQGHVDGKGVAKGGGGQDVQGLDVAASSSMTCIPACLASANRAA